jgi:hypothetical protein
MSVCGSCISGKDLKLWQLVVWLREVTVNIGVTDC